MVEEVRVETERILQIAETNPRQALKMRVGSREGIPATTVAVRAVGLAGLAGNAVVGQTGWWRWWLVWGRRGLDLQGAGAGGSGYVGGVTNSSMQTGIRNGNGLVVLTY